MNLAKSLKDGLFSSALRYVQHRQYKAWSEAEQDLNQLILAPTPPQVAGADVGERSHDAGIPGQISVLVQANETTSPAERIRQSLWQEGQTVLEYGWEAAWRLQTERNAAVVQALLQTWEGCIVPSSNTGPTDGAGK